MRRTPGRPDRASAARRKKMMALGVLLGGLAFIWGRNLLAPAPRAASGDPARAGATDPGDPTGAGLAPTSIMLTWPPVSRRDPFALNTGAYDHRPREVAPDEGPDDPPVVPDPPAEDVDELLAALVLQGTMLSDDPQAMINGELFRVGDHVKGFVIRTIGNRRVVVVRAGVERTLELIEPRLPEPRPRRDGGASKDGEG